MCVVDQHRFDADPDPTSRFDADPNPDPSLNLTHIGKSETSIIFSSFISRQSQRCQNFNVFFGQYPYILNSRKSIV
jgi:hypothetical protein